ncbi:hypothetical protein ACS0TY_012106 [Phlomoides rotata]
MKGIRQGDPISPSLFILVTNCLIWMMEMAMSSGHFRPYTTGTKAVKVSNLHFADDTIFFGEATTENIYSIKCILRIFELWSSLKRGSYNPNYSKKCKTCGIDDEDTNHIFFNCTTAKSVWVSVLKWFGYSYRSMAKGLDHLEEFTALFENHLREVGNLVWQCTIWFICHRRNSIIFRGTAISDDTVFNSICTNSFF